MNSSQTTDAAGAIMPATSVPSPEALPPILDLARQMIPADGYAVWRADVTTGEWYVADSAGLSESYRHLRLKPPEDPKILEAPFEVNDVEDAPHTLIAERQQLYRTEGIRSLLVIPMRIHNANSGTMVFYCRSPHHFSEAEIRRGSALANMSAAAIEAAELYREQVRMRAEAEESERRHAFLGEATALLGSSLDYRATLAQVARLAVPHMADWCAVDVLEDNGLFRQLTLVHAPGSRLDLIREVRREYSPDQSAETGIAQALRSGKPVISTEGSAELLLRAARGSEQMDLMNQAGFQSLMCVPAVARGRTLGAITFVAVDSGRKYGPADLALAEHLGRRAGLAIDNALLYETARRERAAAETSLEASSRSEMRFRRLMESGIIGILLGEEDRVTEATTSFSKCWGTTGGMWRKASFVYQRSRLLNKCI